MKPDDILALMLDRPLVFGIPMAVALAVLVRIGRPRRWWGWLLGTGAIAAILASGASFWYFTSMAGALDRRLDSLLVTAFGETSAHKLSAYRGKVVFLNYWATWCGPCRREIPAINQLTRKWKGQNVVFLAVTDEAPAVVERFLAKMPIEATVATFRSDPPKQAIENMTWDSRPITLIIDTEGKVRRRFVTSRPFEDFDQALTGVVKAARSRRSRRAARGR